MFFFFKILQNIWLYWFVLSSSGLHREVSAATGECEWPSVLFKVTFHIIIQSISLSTLSFNIIIYIITPKKSSTLFTLSFNIIIHIIFQKNHHHYSHYHSILLSTLFKNHFKECQCFGMYSRFLVLISSLMHFQSVHYIYNCLPC